jgi:hypothetical protein
MIGNFRISHPATPAVSIQIAIAEVIEVVSPSVAANAKMAVNAIRNIFKKVLIIF